MRKMLIPVIFLYACSSSNIIYNPSQQILPQHIKSIFVKPFLNKSSIFSIEEKLTLKIIDEFVRNGEYKISNYEKDADGILEGEIKNYIVIPIQYDANFVPTLYKMTIYYSIRMIDKKNNTILFEENNLSANQIYSAPTLSGGMNEETAREKLWDIIAKDVVKRTVEGFGSVTGVSSKKI
jgi:hypothetical protein